MNYYKIYNLDGATLGVASSNCFRKIKNNKVLIGNELNSQYIALNNQLYRPTILVNNIEPKDFLGKYEKVRIVRIDKEEYSAYKLAEIEAQRAMIEYLQKENLE